MIYLRIRELAEQQGLDPRALAHLSGLDPRTVRSYWDDPYRRTTTGILDKLARALKRDVSELITSVKKPTDQ